jgi:hypothetical protein
VDRPGWTGPIYCSPLFFKRARIACARLILGITGLAPGNAFQRPRDHGRQYLAHLPHQRADIIVVIDRHTTLSQNRTAIEFI